MDTATYREKYLKSISLSAILGWINTETDKTKLEAFKQLKALKIESSNPNMKEVLRVIKNKSVFEHDGFIPYSKALSNELERVNVLIPRSYAEYDSNYRQLVCNAIVEINRNSNKLYGFLKRNTSDYSDSSLAGHVGMVGGHVNSTDKTLYSGLIREVSEELKNITLENSKIVPLGYIRETSMTISDNHLCVLYVIKLSDEANMKIYSPDKRETFIWLSPEEINKELNKPKESCMLDSWARLAIREYVKK